MKAQVLKPFLFLIGLMLVVSLACGSTPTATTEPKQPPLESGTSSIISQAVMAADTQGDNYDPVGVTDSFPADQGIFHCVVTISNAPDNTAFKVVWLTASGQQMGEKEVSTSGSRNIDFTFTPDAGALPAGTYRAELSVNGTLDRTVTFSVAGSGAGQESQPAAEPAATEASASQPYFTEEFDGDVSNWSQVIGKNADDGDTSQANISVEDGHLVFDLGKWLLGYVFYDPYDYTDVRIDARVENRGTNVNDVLLVCRSSDEGLYLVNIANSGLYAMYAYDGAKQVYNRIADGGSTKIKPGKEINDYALVCSGKTLTLYINGVETRSYTDNQYVFRKGQVAVGAASEDQIPVKVEFDWVKISQP